ncbi:hypothetical protein O4H48_18440 [Rhodobacteraceae bacterium G21628-S1]|nr:hypothetical protein [Rhodobacteraceae bacterium G21628-S1]
MVVVMKLKYVDELSGGRKRFRRRYPQAVAEVLGESVFQVAMKAREGAELFTEHAKLLAEFEKIVAKAKRTAAEQGQLSPLEHWRESVKEAEALVAGIRGVRDEHEARQVLADDLRARKADPVLYKAVVSPEAEESPITMQDAKEVCLCVLLSQWPLWFCLALHPGDHGLSPASLVRLCVTHLSHSASFHSNERATPSNRGVKHCPRLTKITLPLPTLL